jgi:outer membrane protein assembly factor BamE
MPAPDYCQRHGPREGLPGSPAGLRRPALLLAACCALLAGCTSLDNASQRLAGVVKPYQPQVVQGNFISREQVATLQPGLSRQQVRDALGTPLLTSVFHADRWDYVFTLRRQGLEPQAYRLTVFFKGEALERFEGDTMPTEAEFVASLDVSRKGKPVPPLEATEAQLQRFPAPASAAPAPAAPPPATAYPPLEAPVR